MWVILKSWTNLHKNRGKKERKKEKLREWNATMLSCSTYQREQQGEITLFIAGWALIKQTCSGSCSFQHPLTENAIKAGSDFHSPFSAQESCYQNESSLDRQSLDCCRLPCPPFGEGETSLTLPEWKTEHLLPSRTAPTSSKGKTSTVAQQNKHFFSSFRLHTSAFHCLCSGDIVISSFQKHSCLWVWKTDT